MLPRKCFFNARNPRVWGREGVRAPVHVTTANDRFPFFFHQAAEAVDILPFCQHIAADFPPSDRATPEGAWWREIRAGVLPQ